MRGKRDLELPHDPPPELVIEVDITRSSVKRFPILAAIGVAEVWRYDGERVAFHALDGRQYKTIDDSIVLPPVTAKQATVFLERNDRESAVDWEDALRTWIRSRL